MLSNCSNNCGSRRYRNYILHTNPNFAGDCRTPENPDPHSPTNRASRADAVCNW